MSRTLLIIFILSFFLILCVGCTRHPTGPTYIVSKYITNPVVECQPVLDVFHYHLVVSDTEDSYDYRVTEVEYHALVVGDKWGWQKAEELEEIE